MIKQDEELDKLEEDLRRLKNRYDQFFAGIQKTPPTHDRRLVEVYVHELSRLKIRDNARRFRFNQLVSRLNQLRELWGRKMREREEGPMDFRRRQAALSGPIEPVAPPPRPVERVTSAGADPYVRMAPGSNGEEMKRLYDEIRKEHLKQGKQPNMSFEQMSEMIQKQSEVVRTRYQVNTVAFRVETVDGKVKLKAKPIQD